MNALYQPSISSYDLRLAKLQSPLTIVQLSDFHVGPFVTLKTLATWCAIAQTLAPDVMVLTGDTVDHFFWGSQEKLIKVLAGLSAPLGVWAVVGNHDRARFKKHPERFQDLMQAANIGLLHNSHQCIRHDVLLSGLYDYTDYYKDAPQDFNAYFAHLKDPLKDTTATLAELCHIVLCHNPDFLPLIPKVELILSGHSHGGQIKLPYIGPLHTSSRFGKRFVEGWVKDPEVLSPAYINRGLGVGKLPLRYRCPAEISIFKLSPLKT